MRSQEGERHKGPSRLTRAQSQQPARALRAFSRLREIPQSSRGRRAGPYTCSAPSANPEEVAGKRPGGSGESAGRRGARMNAPPAFESFLLFEGEKK